MRKFILLALSSICFLSCNQSKNSKVEIPLETNMKIETDSIDKSVTLIVDPNKFKLSLIPSTVNVKMMNNTSDTITLGLHYTIEHFENNHWSKVSPDQVFNDIGFSLPEGDFKDFDVKLLKEQIDYEVGKYRIAKDYLKSDYQKTKESFDVFAEFSIE